MEKVKIKIDGEVVEYNSWKQAHNDLVDRNDCTCHCESCCEEDPTECLFSTLDQLHDWELIKEAA